MKEVRICPNCGSTEVGVAPGDLTGLMPSTYVCYSCGFNAPIMPTIEESRIEE